MEYAKRKLDVLNSPNAFQIMKSVESMLSDKNYTKMCTCPLMLSMMVGLLDNSSSKAAQAAFASALVENSEGSSKDIDSGKKGGKGKKGGGGGDVGSKLLPPPDSYYAANPNMPFRDKPSLLSLGVKVAVSHLDIASNRGVVADAKVDSKVVVHFLQKLAWFCHVNHTVDITNSR
jgi:hypothetical protein